MNKNPNLSQYNNAWYKHGAGFIKTTLWFLVNACLFSSFLPGSFWRRSLLRLFGAQVGEGVVIKPYVSVKYPWLLIVGNYSWIGERVWIDNLAKTTIGNNVCISQSAYLLTGNHNYKKVTFDLMIGEIDIKDGVWIGAKSIVCPKVILAENTVISVGSVLTQSTEANGIYQGNPAIKLKERTIS